MPSDPLASVAERWSDPDHAPRQEATEATLAADNRFTEEGIAFAVNHAVDVLASGRLAAWAEGRRVRPGRVGVLAPGRAPLEGFLELAAISALGGEGVGGLDAGSLHLIPSLFQEVASEGGRAPDFVSRRDLFDEAEAITGRGTASDVETWAEAASRRGLAPGDLLLREVRPGLAVLDGREDAATLSGLAEDLLLHEGAALGGVRLIWAPDPLDPDALLDQLSGFRELSPPHPSTEGSLKMRAAFLAAARQPHATGPGFLVSKGAPEEQDGAHVRWVGYAGLSDVAAWALAHPERVGFVVARPALAEALRQGGLPSEVPVWEPGDAHRPEPGRPPLDEAFATFLAG
jgi:hypothetical protein